MRRATLILVGLLAGCQAQPPSAPAPDVSLPKPETLGLDYAGWPSVTEKPYPVAPAFLLMCAPPTAQELQWWKEAEQKERGSHAGSSVVVRVNPVGLDQFKAGQPVPAG